ncbi:MAG: hypothetical protein IME93_03130 [Proteobacteria bacterium]|nr:hypothetical protein [Pseudomonadota bacterium]
MKTAQQILNQEYGNSSNFMTPHILRVGMASKYIAYELSKGEGFNREPIWGVTFVSYSPATNSTERLDSSGCHHTIEEAEKAIEGGAV